MLLSGFLNKFRKIKNIIELICERNPVAIAYLKVEKIECGIYDIHFTSKELMTFSLDWIFKLPHFNRTGQRFLNFFDPRCS